MRLPVRQSRMAAALVLASFTAGCAGDVSEQFFIQPGRFDYLSCSELVSARQQSAQREQELKILIDRAEKEPAGVLLAVGSYRGDYLHAQGEQKMQSEVMARKNCPADTLPSPKPPTTEKTHRRR